MLDMEINSFEVHARKREGGKIVFRIWDGQKDRYVTKTIKSAAVAVQRLIELETKRFEEEIKKEAPKRVQVAKEDGFESPFVTSGELSDPWKKEGRHITRGLC